MTKRSHAKLTIAYGKRIVDQSLGAWNALNKAVEMDATISELKVKAKSSYGLWEVLNSVVDEDSDNAEDYAKINFEVSFMVTGESAVP